MSRSLDGSTALVGNFAAAGLDHAGVEWPNLWLFVAVLAALFSVWLTCRDMRLAARLMLVSEAVSILAIMLLTDGGLRQESDLPSHLPL
jgi:amino acid transporter